LAFIAIIILGVFALDADLFGIFLGIADEQLPPWVANLALWVSEDRISMGDMIVSIEHLINN